MAPVSRAAPSAPAARALTKIEIRTLCSLQRFPSKLAPEKSLTIQQAIIAVRRRAELLSLLDHLSDSVEELNQAVEEAGHNREDVRLLMTHPGSGPHCGAGFCSDHRTGGPVSQ